MMQLLILACVLAGCLAQQPVPCTSPPLLSGALAVFTQNERLWSFGNYLYDAPDRRVRLTEVGSYRNESFAYDALLLYKEAVMYEINVSDRTCKKKPLKADFHPLEVPKDANPLGPSVVGSSSGPGQGLLVTNWWGDLPDKTGKYMTTFTEFGCIPVVTFYQTEEFGWVSCNFANNVVGIPDPGQLDPPDFCQDVETTAAEPADFLSVFLRKD